jgi:hypothetical protein
MKPFLVVKKKTQKAERTLTKSCCTGYREEEQRRKQALRKSNPQRQCRTIGRFMKAHIDPKAKITTDKWTGYIPLKADFENLTRVASGKKGSNFPELHRVVMNLKSWLTGVHHHVNDLQDYLNEYCYRFNRSFMKENIFDNLMKRMIEAEPCYIKNISQ